MKKGTRQLLAKIWRPILDQFNNTIESACLRRDAYLDHVLAHEAKLLKDEIPDRNSRKTRTYLQTKLDVLDRIPVSFSVSPATIEAVNHACQELNVIRDCFVNRVLFLLLADQEKSSAITGIPLESCLPELLGENDRDFLYAPLWSGGLNAISEIVRSDPFRALRNAIDWFREQDDEDIVPLHACLIEPEMFSKKPPGAIALNCYLPDWSVPESHEAGLAHPSLAEIFGDALRKDSRGAKTERQRKESK